MYNRNNKKNFRKARPVNRSAIFRPKARCSLESIGITDVDYKDISFLRQYVDEEWKIRPGRFNGLSAIMQRKIKTSIKRARYLSLFPYMRNHHIQRDIKS